MTAVKSPSYTFTPYAVVKIFGATQPRGTRVAVAGYDAGDRLVKKVTEGWDFSRSFMDQVTDLVSQVLEPIDAASDRYLAVDFGGARILIPVRPEEING